MRYEVDIKPVDLEEFLGLIEEQEILDDYTKMEYTSLVKYEDPRSNMGQIVPKHESLVAPIVYGDKLSVIRTSLMHQARVGEITDVTFEKMAIEHINEYGKPTHLVKIDTDVHMIANPKDFKIVYHLDGSYGLLLLAKVRTKLYTGIKRFD